jgi:replication-associated recombination protein RarA
MQPLVEKYRPRRIQDFAGLSGPRAIFRRFAESPFSSAWLSVGPAGIGKTTMAYALAENVGGQIYHIPARACDLETVRDTVRQCHYLPMFGNWNWVIVDEADQMTAAAQLTFLSILDSTEMPPNTIFLFTCNETKKLEPRFLTRTRVVRFDLEKETAAAVDYLTTIWRAEVGSAPAPDLATMFVESEYNLRDCLMKLEVEIMMREPVPVAPARVIAPATPTMPIAARFKIDLFAGANV